MPTAPIQDGNAQIEFKIQADRQAFGLLKYFIQVKNLIAQPVTVEARFCVLASVNAMVKMTNVPNYHQKNSYAIRCSILRAQ